MADSSVLRVIFGLVLVIAAILLAAWLARRAGISRRSGTAILRQIAALPLGPRQNVVIVQVEKTWLVLGVTAGAISVLHTLPAGEASLTPAAAESFAQKLGQALKG